MTLFCDPQRAAFASQEERMSIASARRRRDKPHKHAGAADWLGARERVEIIHDLLAGESAASLLAERHEVSERTITRIRASLRKNGFRVRAVAMQDPTTCFGRFGHARRRRP